MSLRGPRSKKVVFFDLFRGRRRRNSLSCALAILSLASAILIPSLGSSQENRVLALAREMEAVLDTLNDYTCEVENVYFAEGVEIERYRFKFYFKKEDHIRVDFSQPYPSLTVFYRNGDKDVTVKPIGFLPGLKFRLSIDNPLIRTPSGQRITQTHMGYFLRFVLRNLHRIDQGKEEIHDNGEEITFLLMALDYVSEKNIEMYRITLSKRLKLPVRIERYTQEGKLLETTHIRDYRLNGSLDLRLFLP